MTDEKTCANEACGKPFTRRLHTRESKAGFAARKYCCLDCANEVARAGAYVGEKTCRNKACGKTYAKRPRETRNEFQRRSYCCVDCSRSDNHGRGRILPRKPTPALVEVVRAPGQPWRPAGWSEAPNVYAGVRQAC